MDNATNGKASETVPLPAKKAYTTPSFRFESVFEISALSCGKMQSTQGGCAHVRKAS
jgi:hypothetical protein